MWLNFVSFTHILQKVKKAQHSLLKVNESLPFFCWITPWTWLFIPLNRKTLDTFNERLRSQPVYIIILAIHCQSGWPYGLINKWESWLKCLLYGKKHWYLTNGIADMDTSRPLGSRRTSTLKVKRLTKGWWYSQNATGMIHCGHELRSSNNPLISYLL